MFSYVTISPINTIGMFHLNTYRSFATTLSQLKICDFSGETFKGYEML